jgi:hypothetical protein
MGSSAIVRIRYLAVTPGFPAARVSEFPRYPAVERGIGGLVLFVERERGALERVEDVAEVQLRNFRYALPILIHAFGQEESE